MSGNASFGPHERLTQARIDGRYDEELARILDEANDYRIDWVQAQLEEQQRVPMMSSADVSWRTRRQSGMFAARDRITDSLIDGLVTAGPLMSRMECYRMYVHDWPLIDLFMSKYAPAYATHEDGR